MSKFLSAIKGARSALAAAAFTAVALPGIAQADITIGVIVSATGSTAALGIPMQNALIFMPEEIDGHKVKVVFGDDTSDPSTATNLARRMITQDKVDVIIGSSMTGAAIAIAGVTNENAVPQLAMSPINLPEGRDAWTFRMPQQVSLMAAAVIEDMVAKGVKTVGYIGFSDAWGDFWSRDLETLGKPAGLTTVAEERFGRADTSVTGQVLKLLAARPDVVLIGASGTASAMPQIELRQRGFTGAIYQTHGSVSPDFIRIGGRAVEGTILPAGPVTVAEQMPDDAEVKGPGVAFLTRYEQEYGENSRNQFAGHMYDAIQALNVALPVALKTAQPGTPEFRTAIKDALESGLDIPAAHGVFQFSPTDHFGLDDRGRVLITVEDGQWKLL